ncbi:keratin, ultra high-sulfur matrix protein isoform X2 [Drosophila persimilis]|uniref:Keratin, ultra high-sulfur matrix protein isoform X2 n=2 Tax=pseudoobscura subgroup TaxID=32358 RepID=B5DK67_DROPS|nr:keratin, ultra high-sulfur matrix protein isoform X2 [Drosophila persimilis]XP_002133290.2 keratin, ultra high-sulfur matrix protein isoform X2 [Drosophila pseudoobscura]
MCDPCGPFAPRGCRSRELRCGIMYTTCDCVKRNGLQDKCPRSACQGRPACLCFPYPNCGPSAFPLRYANMTMGVNNKRMRCQATGAGGGGGGGGGACGGRAAGGCCSAGPCSSPGPCCGPSPCCARYLAKKEENRPCVWCAPCKAHCYNTPPKCCC